MPVTNSANCARRALLLASAALLGATSAYAQDMAPSSATEADAATTDEIIVTAQKRSERLSDVPLSVTAASGEQLAKQGVTSAADLTKVVPGFTYQKSTYGVPVFTIRGIGLYDTSVGIAPTVSVYVDQVPLPYLVMTSGAALDIERVEVLKGPQGTLFGQNSTGGAINYVAAKPTSEPHMGFDLSFGRFKAVNAQGFVSGPISDTIAVRFAARHESQDDWQKSQTRPDDRLGDRNFSAGRLLVDWTPSDSFKLELNVNGWQDKSETQAAQYLGFRASRPAPAGYLDSFLAIGNRAPAPNEARVADWDPGVDFHRDDWQYQFAGRADWQLSDVLTLTSITSYTRFSTVAPVDSDGTEFNNFRRTLDATIRSFSQELRVAGDFDFAKITAGLNYQDDKTDELNATTYISSNNGVGPRRYNRFNNISNQEVKTYAAFASVDVPLTPTLTAQLGGRYTKQNRDFQGCLADAGDGALAAAIAGIPVSLAGRPYQPAPAGSCVTLDSSFNRLPVVTNSLDQDNWSWRAGLNWKPTEDSLVYANVTRGYKAGAFVPLPAVFARQLTPVTQEEVTAYELGAKASLIDRVLDASAAVFYYDYKNKQILGTGNFPPFGALPQLQNVPKSSVRGAEVELLLRPFAGLRLRGGGTYVKSRVDESYRTPDPVGIVVDVKGESFPNTPRWQLLGDAEYGFAAGAAHKAYVGGGFSYRSASNAAFGENPTFRFKPYTLVDLRAGFGAADDSWTVEAWGRNVFNTFYWNNVNYAVDSLSRTVGLPATYGMTLRTRF